MKRTLFLLVVAFTFITYGQQDELLNNLKALPDVAEVDVDYGNTDGNIVLDRNELIDVPNIFETPEPPQLLTEAREIEIPLFHKGGGSTIVREVGPNGVYYLWLRPGYYLAKMAIEPEDVFVDVTLKDERTVYCFYNGTARSCISISAVVSEDIEGVAGKLAENLGDPIWRQYILRLTLDKTGVVRGQSIESMPEILTAEGVAKLLSIEKKTIQNWTSEGRIPYKKLGGTTRYKKSEITEAFDKGQIGNVTRWKTRGRKRTR